MIPKRFFPVMMKTTAFYILILFYFCISGCDIFSSKPNESGVGRGNSIKVDNQGLPHISYVDDRNLAIKYAYYDGSGWNKEFVEKFSKDDCDPGEVCIVNVPTFLELDNSGKPNLVYYDRFKMQIKYAVKENQEWKINIIDDIKNLIGEPVDEYYKYTNYFEINSFRLDSKNNPNITYAFYNIHITSTDTNIKPDFFLKYAYLSKDEWIVDDLSNGSRPYKCAAYLALDSNDRPHITVTQNGSVKYYQWNGNEWLIEDIGNYNARAFIVLNSLSQPNVLLEDIPEGCCPKYVKYAFKNGTDWQIEDVKDGYNPGCSGEEYNKWTSNILVNKSDLIVYIYSMHQCDNFKKGMGKLRIGIRENGIWKFVPVKDENTYGDNPRISLDSNDNFYISYTHISGDAAKDFIASLKYAFYDGIDWKIETVDK